MTDAIDIDEVRKNADWMYGIWFAERKDRRADWMAQLMRSGGKWYIIWRFRYYHSAKAFDSNDRKNWYSASTDDGSDGSRDKAIDAIEEIAAGLTTDGVVIEGEEADFENLDKVIFDCPPNSDEMISKLESANKPWMHIKKVELPEGEGP